MEVNSPTSPALSTVMGVSEAYETGLVEAKE
jgi:hypothetical protein